MAIMDIYISKQNEKSVLDVSTSIIDSLILEPGCISCRALKAERKPRALTLVQEWKSQAALATYIRSDEYRKTLALLELSVQQPEITFLVVSKTMGLEFIQKSRGMSDEEMA